MHTHIHMCGYVCVHARACVCVCACMYALEHSELFNHVRSSHLQAVLYVCSNLIIKIVHSSLAILLKGTYKVQGHLYQS